jgi:hypothetical protein
MKLTRSHNSPMKLSRLHLPPCLVALVFLTVLQASPLLAADIYVSPRGSDTADGTRVHPFQTLERARDAVRAMRSTIANGPVTVWLGGGDYRVTHPFVLTEEDSGLAKSPVVYRGSEEGTVRLHGALAIKPSDFKPVTEAVAVARVAETARGRILELDLGPLEVKHAGRYPDVFNDNGGLLDLFFNGKRMPLSRYPNKGYATIKRVLDNAGGIKDRNWAAPHVENIPKNGNGGTFEYREEVYGQFALWKKQLDRGVWLKGFWRIPWQNEAVRVGDIDTERHTVTLSKPIAGGIGSKYQRPEGNGKEPYWLLNLLEEVDQPGEWCIDFEDKKLYFYPPESLDKAEIALADSAEPVVDLNGVSHVTLRGITIEENLGDGIRIKGGEGNLIAGCTIRNVDKYAAVIDGGKSHAVLSCDLYDLGEGGVSLAGGDDKASPRVPAGHRVVNNHIHHFSQITRIYTPAVKSGYVHGGTSGHFPAVGMYVAHNLVHDTPHAGILTASYDSLFEYNEIFRFATVSDDIGGFYSFEHYALDGNRTFRYNLIHHSGDGDGIYFDNDHNGMKVYGNIVYLESTGKRGDGLIFKNGQQDKSPPQRSEVTNNIFMRCRVGGLVFTPAADSNLITNNIVVQCGTPWDWSELGNGKWKRAAGFQPPGNAVYSEDPGFMDAARLDFRIKPDSGIRKDLPDFQPIPVEKIGLYVDEYRKSLPTDEEIQRYSSKSQETGLNQEILDRK